MRFKHYITTTLAITFTLMLRAGNLDNESGSEILFQNEYVKIEKSHSICKSNQGYDYDYALLKFTNLTNQDIDFVYDMQVEYDNGKGKTSKGDLVLYELSIPANGFVEGTCEQYYKKQLSVFDHSLTNHPNAYKGKLIGISIVEFKLK